MLGMSHFRDKPSFIECSILSIPYFFVVVVVYSQEPVYFVLENDGQNKAPPKEVIPADEDAPRVPKYNPVNDVPAASPAPPPVGRDIITSSAQPEAVYAEISTRSAAKLL